MVPWASFQSLCFLYSCQPWAVWNLKTKQASSKQANQQNPLQERVGNNTEGKEEGKIKFMSSHCILWNNTQKQPKLGTSSWSALSPRRGQHSNHVSWHFSTWSPGPWIFHGITRIISDCMIAWPLDDIPPFKMTTTGLIMNLEGIWKMVVAGALGGGRGL